MGEEVEKLQRVWTSFEAEQGTDLHHGKQRSQQPASCFADE